jgi:hypothetical protein
MHKARVLCRSRRVAGSIVLALVAVAPLLSGSARGETVTLAWDPTSDPTVVGYDLYYGGASHTYTNIIAVGSVAHASISGLLPGARYFFAAAAVDSVGLQSAFSNEISYQVPGELVVTNNDGTITITGYTGPAGAVAIPIAINGRLVTSIGDSAFSATSLTSVTIPDGVTSIGDGAFAYCTNLTSVTIGNSVTNIGSGGFWFCTSLTNVVIPDSVTSIGDGAFEYCSSLTSVTIGNSVTNIASDAFRSCRDLTGVYFQGNAPTCGSFAFRGDYAAVYYLAGTTGWGPTFGGLPAFLWDPVSQAAYTTTNGTIIITGYTGPGGSVIIPGTINGLPVAGIGGSAFSGCTRLTSVTIPDSVTSIGDGAFEYCTNLSSVTIGNSVTNVGSDAFGFCTSLADVTMGNGVTSIGSGGFWFCTSLTNVMIPDSVTSIGEGAFGGCAGLSSVTIGNSVANIGSDAFGSCSNLTRVYFQGNAPTCGSFAFWGDDATVYYLAGTTGWGTTFGGCPTALWENGPPGIPAIPLQPHSRTMNVRKNATFTVGVKAIPLGGPRGELWSPEVQTSGASFGVRTAQFGFTITGTSNLVIVVEASTNLASPVWYPVQTNTLTSGSWYFSDPEWTKYPGRFYRLAMP